jgi:hypothetical protein
MKDLTAPPMPVSGRARRAEPGRKKATEKDSELVAALESLVEPDARANPESPLRLTCKSTRELARAVTKAGHPVSGQTVDLLLHQLG